MIIISGSANYQLAKETAELLKADCLQAETTKFADTEFKVRINQRMYNQTAVVIQSISRPASETLLELLLIIDSLKRQEAKEIIVVIPYFGFSRQNIEHLKGESVSFNLIANILQNLNLSRVITCELHDEASSGVFSIPFTNLNVFDELSEAIKNYLDQINITTSATNITIVSPDQGGLERARKFGEIFFNSDNFNLAVTEKKRNLQGIHDSKAVEIYGSVENKLCLIVDDVSTSAGTLINSAELCLKYKASKILAVIVHKDFTQEAVEKINNSKIEKIFTTNTITRTDLKEPDKIATISVASKLAEILQDYKN
ncbi:MAG: ribose-phosphate pyrophosphokinase [Patescibacteria group bacterium]|nr:MAG: ribose-phosphate pyrophosphokinase [Patescibacteria group bacterium]